MHVHDEDASAKGQAALDSHEWRQLSPTNAGFKKLMHTMLGDVH